MDTKKGTTRDRETGRYAHEWGCIGFNEEQNYQIDRCEDCGKVRVSNRTRLFKSVDDAAAHGITGFLEHYGPGRWGTPEPTPEPKTPCSECGHEWDDAATAEVCCTFVFSIDETTCCGCPCETCRSTPAQTEALDSTEPASDVSPTPPAEASTRGVAKMAITDRNLPVGTKLVAKYLGQTYHAEVVEFKNGAGALDNAPRYRMTLAGETKDYKSPSAMGSAIMGVDKAGKPRTCNGWSFWSLDGGEQPSATSAPTGSTRTRKPKEAKVEPTADAGAPTAAYECAECHASFDDSVALSEHFNSDHGAQQADEQPVDQREPAVA